MTRFAALILQKKTILREIAQIDPHRKRNVYNYAPLSMDLVSKNIQKLNKPRSPSPKIPCTRYKTIPNKASTQSYI